MKKIKIRIIVPANTDIFNQRMMDAVQSVIPSDVEIDVTNIQKGTPHIQNRTDFNINSSHVIELAKQTENEGFDGIFVSDFDFCGVEPARESINIPIIGAFRPSAFTAIALSEKIGLITIMRSVVAMQEGHFRNFGILDNLACILPINVTVSELSNQKIVISKVYDKAMEAIEKGAQSIILGCTGCTGFIGIAEPVAELLKDKGYDIPVIDPNRTGITFIIMLVRNKLLQSRLTYKKCE
jgi:allantoin racemase